MKPKLLIVEDEEPIRTQLKYALRDDFSLLFAEDRVEALSRLAGERPAVVSLDLGLPPHPETAECGLETLDQIMRTAPATKVVVLTGNGGRDNAIRSVQLGAFDYHQKPIQLNELRVVLQLEALARTRGNITQASRLLVVSRPTLHGLIGRYGVTARDFR